MWLSSSSRDVEACIQGTPEARHFASQIVLSNPWVFTAHVCVCLSRSVLQPCGIGSFGGVLVTVEEDEEVSYRLTLEGAN